MSLARYEFCEENKSLLLNFIKKSNMCKSNPRCDIVAYKNLSKILPVDYILEKYPEQTDIIEIADSEEDQWSQEDLSKAVTDILQNSLQPLNETVADDICYAIKEIVQTKKELTSTVISDLEKPNLDLVSIFKQLFNELSFKEIVDLGVLLNDCPVINDNIILHYVKYMLVKQLALEYSDQLQDILNDLCTRNPEILTEELSNYLLYTVDSYPRVTLQFVDGLGSEFKFKLLRSFVANCQNLEENHIAVIDILLGNQIEDDILNKVVELMSKSTEAFSTSKVFGKFLLKTIQLVGKNISLLEKPMNHIIGNHRSIWKAKIQKTYDEFMQDSILMSQSLRY